LPSHSPTPTPTPWLLCSARTFAAGLCKCFQYSSRTIDSAAHAPREKKRSRGSERRVRNRKRERWKGER
jgi:hypothetical protein